MTNLLHCVYHTSSPYIFHIYIYTHSYINSPVEVKTRVTDVFLDASELTAWHHAKNKNNDDVVVKCFLNLADVVNSYLHTENLTIRVKCVLLTFGSLKSIRRQPDVIFIRRQSRKMSPATFFRPINEALRTETCSRWKRRRYLNHTSREIPCNDTILKEASIPWLLKSKFTTDCLSSC